MRTIKLKNGRNKKKCKGTRRRKMNTTKIGGNSPTISSRTTRSSHHITPAFFLNDNESSRHTTLNNIKKFIKNKLKRGPYIINIPIPPEKHAILVDVQPDDKKIMISDWTGDKIMDYNKRDHAYQERRKTYKLFIDEIKNHFKDYSLGFFEVDDHLYEIADEKHECQGGHGGCSNYIYAWKEKYCDENQCYDEPINP